MTREINTPIGKYLISETDGAITSIAPISLENCGTCEGDCPPVLLDAARQMEEYFAGTRRVFDLPLSPGGTEFFRAVWDALREIPFGQVKTYGEIAALLGRPKAARAVGMACNRNPLMIVVPCHRVVGAGFSGLSDRGLVGFRGGVEMKRQLLLHEKAGVNSELGN